MNAASVREHIIDSLYICHDEVCVLSQEQRNYLYNVARQLKTNLTELRKQQKIDFVNLYGDESIDSAVHTTRQQLRKLDELLPILRPEVRVNRDQMETILWVLQQLPNEEEPPNVVEQEYPGNIVHPASGEPSDADGDPASGATSNSDGGPASEEMPDADEDLASNRQAVAQPATEPCHVQ